MRRILAVAAIAILASIVGGCGGGGGGGGGGKVVIETVADAFRYIDDLFRGKSPDEFTLAASPSPVAQAAVRDAEELSNFQAVIDEAPDTACDVVGLVSRAADAAPDVVEPVVLEPADRLSINIQASTDGLEQDQVMRVTDASLRLAQSTFVEAADNLCDITQTL